MAPAKNGWYFLGREPLSSFARIWNSLVLAALAGLIASVGYNAYTSSASYIAGRQMSEARRLVGQGQLAQAARIYQSLSAAGADESDNANQAIKGLVGQGVRTGAVAGVGRGVRRGRPGPPRPRADHGPLRRWVDRGLKLVGEKGDADPRAAMTIAGRSASPGR